MKLNFSDLEYAWRPERWEDKSAAQQAGETDWAWRQWIIASCVESSSGHAWYLTIDPDDGIDFGCRHCPAGVDELVPDGVDLLAGTFEVSADYKLTLDCGGVVVNDRWADKQNLWTVDGLGITYGWRGPVTAKVREEKYGGYFEPAEYDVWIDLEAS